MATSTTKLGLTKPDFVDVVDISELNDNADAIDAAVGATIVTSATRPASPWAGQIIYETDTESSFVWTGSAWIIVVPEALPSTTIEETTTRTADYTLAIADAGKIVPMNKASAATLTVPTNASVAFPVGTIVGIYNLASDAVTVAGDSGVTVRNAGTINQYAEASLRKRDTNEWVMVGG